MSFFKSSLSVAILLLLGRLLGFGREWIIAYQGGASESTDVAIVLLTFPDLMVNFILGGGVTAALVPAFKQLDQRKAFGLYLLAAGLVGCLFTGIAAILSFYPKATLTLVAPGMTESVRVSASYVFQWTNVALPLTALSGVSIAFLNANQRFLAGASGTLIFNSCIIFFIAATSEAHFLLAMVTGIVIGAGLRLLVQTLALRKLFVRPTISFSVIDSKLIWRFFGGLGFVSTLSLIPPTARAFTSNGAPGDISIFNYSQKLIELPMAVFVSSIITVLLPRLGAMIAHGKLEESEQFIGEILRISFLILLCLATAAVLFPEALIRTAFYGSSLTDSQISTLVGVARIGFIAIPFQGSLLIYGTIATAYSKPAMPVIACILMLSTILIFSPFLFKLFQLKGIMAVYVCAYVLGAVFLSNSISRMVGNRLFVVVFGNFKSNFFFPTAVCILFGSISFYIKLDFMGQLAFFIMTISSFAGSVLAFDASLRQKAIKILKNASL